MICLLIIVIDLLNMNMKSYSCHIIFNESIALVNHHHDGNGNINNSNYSFDIWVLGEYGNKDSWIMLFTIPITSHSSRTTCRSFHHQPCPGLTQTRLNRSRPVFWPGYFSPLPPSFKAKPVPFFPSVHFLLMPNINLP